MSEIGQQVEAFIAANGVDESAAKALRDCRGDVQERVLYRGEVRSARNPSAALHARIREARSALANQNLPSRIQLQAEVEEFISAHGVDTASAVHLRTALPEVQRQVLQRGHLGDSRNPSSALVARIQEVKKGSGSQNQTGVDCSLKSISDRPAGIQVPSSIVQRSDNPDVIAAIRDLVQATEALEAAEAIIKEKEMEKLRKKEEKKSRREQTKSRSRSRKGSRKQGLIRPLL